MDVGDITLREDGTQWVVTRRIEVSTGGHIVVLSRHGHADRSRYVGPPSVSDFGEPLAALHACFDLVPVGMWLSGMT